MDWASSSRASSRRLCADANLLRGGVEIEVGVSDIRFDLGAQHLHIRRGAVSNRLGFDDIAMHAPALPDGKLQLPADVERSMRISPD